MGSSPGVPLSTHLPWPTMHRNAPRGLVWRFTGRLGAVLPRRDDNPRHERLRERPLRGLSSPLGRRCPRAADPYSATLPAASCRRGPPPAPSGAVTSDASLWACALLVGIPCASHPATPFTALTAPAAACAPTQPPPSDAATAFTAHTVSYAAALRRQLRLAYGFHSRSARRQRDLTTTAIAVTAAPTPIPSAISTNRWRRRASPVTGQSGRFGCRRVGSSKQQSKGGDISERAAAAGRSFTL